VIILGLLLLILGVLLDVGLLWTLGIILVVAGVILYLIGVGGRTIAGRRYWY